MIINYETDDVSFGFKLKSKHVPHDKYMVGYDELREPTSKYCLICLNDGNIIQFGGKQQIADLMTEMKLIPCSKGELLA